MKIGVADTAKEDFNLYIVRGWFAPRDRSKGQRRCRTGRGVSFRVVHVLNLNVRPIFRFAQRAIVHARYANCSEVVQDLGESG